MTDLSSPAVRARLAEAFDGAVPIDRLEATAHSGSADALVDAVAAALQALPPERLAQAVALRAGADEPGAAGEGLSRAAEGVDAALARGAAVYEARFGRPLLIRTEGREAQDVLDEVQRRLKQDPKEEAAEAGQDLRRVVAARLRALLQDSA